MVGPRRITHGNTHLNCSAILDRLPLNHISHDDALLGFLKTTCHRLFSVQVFSDEITYPVGESFTIFCMYSRTPLIRPPSESHWCGRIRGMVAREGFVYEQKPLSVTRNVVV